MCFHDIESDKGNNDNASLWRPAVWKESDITEKFFLKSSLWFWPDKIQAGKIMNPKRKPKPREKFLPEQFPGGRK